MKKVLTLAKPPMWDNIITNLFAQTVGSHGCNGCLEIDGERNIYAPDALPCPRCKLPDIMDKFAEHTGNLTLNMIRTYELYIDKEKLYADDIYTPLRALPRRVY